MTQPMSWDWEWAGWGTRATEHLMNKNLATWQEDRKGGPKKSKVTWRDYDISYEINKATQQQKERETHTRSTLRGKLKSIL